MDTKYLFYITLLVSIIVQFVTGIFELGIFFIKVPDIYNIIRELLLVELVVQFIEGSFHLNNQKITLTNSKAIQV